MKPNFSKEQLEYELVTRYFELRDGELWVKDFVGKDGKVYKARPAKGTDKDGYRRIKVDGKRFYVHRIIFILTHNRPIKEGYQIHHIYGNKADNRIEFLEEVSHQENCQNKQVHLDGKLVGVSPHKASGKWQARIRVNGKQYHLGLYETSEDGYKVYLLAVEEIETYGRLIRTNTQRAAAAGVIPCIRGSRLRNSKPRGECEALEHDQLRTDSKRG